MDRKVPRIDYVADLSFKDKEIMTMVYMSSTYKTLVESETIYILDIYPKFLFSPIFFFQIILKFKIELPAQEQKEPSILSELDHKNYFRKNISHPSTKLIPKPLVLVLDL